MWKRFSDKIHRTFFDYGKLCSAHPIACISLSLLSVVFLSYPAMLKMELPVSSPFDVFWHQKKDFIQDPPAWLNGRPGLYIQQIVLTANVDPWNSTECTPDIVIRAAILQTFRIREIAIDVKTDSSLFKNLCLQVNTDGRSECLLLSPALIWNDDINKVKKDADIRRTIYKHQCHGALCKRDLLLGTPIWNTGIKKNYQTNRQRTIHLGVTLLFTSIDDEWRNLLIKTLSERFTIIRSHAFDEDTLIHVYYRPGHYFSDYFPILASYFVCAIYFYYTVKKFEMVKSKVGLAVASFFTVVFTLTTTLGICHHLDMSASVGRSRLFPYLAMIVGLENILCITRSVVYIPPSFDISFRVAHGLSEEGQKITKYFLLELHFLLFGYLTQVPEIQEFCLFAFIGIVVDLYMQLFFYTPCLIFDLSRMDSDDRKRFSLMLLSSNIRKFKKYQSPKCPAEYIFPSLFKRKNKLTRTLSEDNLKDNNFKKSHKRSSSSSVHKKNPSDSTTLEAFSNRLRVLHYWTRTRIAQRIIMISFILWVVWLAFLVQKWRVFEGLFGEPSNLTSQGDLRWISHHILDTAPLEWSVWQTSTFKWWPLLLEQYNLSLSGFYVTFLPIISLRKSIPYNDPELQIIAGNIQNKVNLELQDRIDWLEREMSRWLIISAILPFLIVILFILYMCFWEKWLQWRNELKSAFALKRSTFRTRLSSVELTPLAFSRHELPVECASVHEDTIVSASVNGQVFIWDAKSGELRNSLLRYKQNQVGKLRSNSMFLPNEPVNQGDTKKRSSVWCLDVNDIYIVIGCSDGEIQLGRTKDGEIVQSKAGEKAGVTHINILGNRVVAGRLTAIVEVMEISTFIDNYLSHSLYGHNNSVISICIDEEQDLLFSSCDSGRICCWSIETGRLLRSLEKEDSLPVEIICTTKYLIGFSIDAGLWVWDKQDGDLIFNLSLHEQTDPLTLLLDIDENIEPVLREGRFLARINDSYVCTSDVDSVQIWDIEARSVVKQIRLPAPIDSIQNLDQKSVLCCAGTELYRISAPIK
ncbi:unnamed protein product [Bursaphelenchus xylophilus]|uniref:Sterol regulatory element-binding protein cleavage-activating protein n=1 Tax=Bursaphelenchus xylophilus TaxID=6326 RepID=A0A811KK93_BURXY|nr:unnamed protein product [Bursaphelenchus xylophilus]CAG9098413.1 unnamed protein product [Bursaphelenchus xylophilus]